MLLAVRIWNHNSRIWKCIAVRDDATGNHPMAIRVGNEKIKFRHMKLFGVLRLGTGPRPANYFAINQSAKCSRTETLVTGHFRRQTVYAFWGGPKHFHIIFFSGHFSNPIMAERKTFCRCISRWKCLILMILIFLDLFFCCCKISVRGLCTKLENDYKNTVKDYF